jgi:ATP-binding protein involved in chromosome partitioning
MMQEKILSAISTIKFSDGSDLVSKASGFIIKDGVVNFAVDIDGFSLKEAKIIETEAINAITSLLEINKVNIALTSSKVGKKDIKTQKQKHNIEGVKKLVLISSCKGGVGKTTVSTIIAENLKLQGFSVGIVDADIYGPSLPTIFALSAKPKIENGKMLPLYSKSGIQVMSIGFLTPDSNSPIAWRGPMASKAIYQLLSLTKWDNLDYLIVDMPPTTGDIHLSILDNYVIDSAIIITTPQIISSVDVGKCINLYKQFDIPILGIIENMSYFIDPISKKEVSIFNGNAGTYLAKEHNLRLLLRLPIVPEISIACDTGQNLSDIFEIKLDQVFR